jgi:hypothetical protein
LRRGLRGLRLSGGWLLVWIAGDVLALVEHADAGMEFVVVGVLERLTHVDVFAQIAVAAGKMQDAVAVGVDRKPIFAVDELTIGDEGR